MIHSKKVLNKTLYHLFVVLFGFVMVYPVLWMVSGSFKGNAEILRGTLALIPNELKLDNYATGWKGLAARPSEPSSRTRSSSRSWRPSARC